MRRQIGLLGIAALPFIGLASGCSQAAPDRGVRMTRGYIYYLDGAGGGSALSNWGGGVREGLRSAGYEGAGEMFTWNTGLGVVADQDASVAYKRTKAGELARKIQEYSRDHPGAPITLMGLSAGTAVAVFTLEALPGNCQVDDVILLGASISADYDLTRALQRVRNRMHVFTSERDAVLAFAVTLAGTADRTSSPSAGLRGFIMPAGASSQTRSAYGKVSHIGWRPEFAMAGDFGGHTDTVKAPFVEKYIAPLITTRAAQTPSEATSESGKVLNPDYARWARFQIGSLVTFEGYQVVGGVKKPLRLTVRLVSSQRDRLVIERTYEFSDPAVPMRVQRFIAPSQIDPHEHPLTHPAAVIKDLPSETLRIGGKTFECNVRTIECAAHFPEWGSDVRCTLYLCDKLPGGLGRISLQAMRGDQPFEFAGQLVSSK